MPVPSIVKKLSLSLGTLVVVLGIPVLWAWYTFAGPGYYAEFNAIKARLSALPGVELIRAWGNEDITFEDIGAEIRVKGKGDICFFALSPESFASTPVLCLQSIGPYRFECGGTGYVGVVMSATGEPVRSVFFGSAIDIGSGGECARFFPFEVRNVQDVIARYDEICAVLAQWPVAPNRLKFRDGKGTDHYVSLKPVP